MDGAGNTALQIVCGGTTIRENTVEIARLLLEKKVLLILNLVDFFKYNLDQSLQKLYKLNAINRSQFEDF